MSDKVACVLFVQYSIKNRNLYDSKRKGKGTSPKGATKTFGSTTVTVLNDLYLLLVSIPPGASGVLGFFSDSNLARVAID